jgi:ABC-type antimicrobial peptide transport system permease subunit
MGTSVSLMGSSATDPLIYLAAAVFLCILSAAAAYLPARRAASIDPMKALRTE